jgi:hypothetical protein
MACWIETSGMASAGFEAVAAGGRLAWLCGGAVEGGGHALCFVPGAVSRWTRVGAN